MEQTRADGAHRMAVAFQQAEVVRDIAGAAAEVPSQRRHDEGHVQQVDLVRQYVIAEAAGIHHHRVVGERAADQCRHASTISQLSPSRRNATKTAAEPSSLAIADSG